MEGYAAVARDRRSEVGGVNRGVLRGAEGGVAGRRKRCPLQICDDLEQQLAANTKTRANTVRPYGCY